MGIPCATSASACCDNGRVKDDPASVLVLRKDTLSLPPHPTSSFSKHTSSKPVKVIKTTSGQSHPFPSKPVPVYFSSSKSKAAADNSGEKTLVNHTKLFVSHESNMRGAKGRPLEKAAEEFTKADASAMNPPLHESGSTLRSSGNQKHTSAEGAMYPEVLKSDLSIEVRKKEVEPIKLPAATMVETKSKGSSYVDPALDFTKRMMSVMSMLVPNKEGADPNPDYRRGEAPGTFEERYKIVCKLEGGNCGEVSRIVERTTEAVRVVRRISKAKSRLSEKFIDDVRILKKLDHPNVAHFFEFYQDDMNYYLVTEFCEGGNLLKMLGEVKSFTQGNVARILHQILSGVEYCHALKIVHMDLRPENILFEKDSLSARLKVAVLGKAPLTELSGSIYYVAPEIIAGKEYSPACDLWSAGVLMYIMLCGSPPFFGKSQEETVAKIKSGHVDFSPAIFSKLDPAAMTLIKAMLELEPEKRITAREALKSPWLKLSAEEEEKTRAGDARISLRKLKNFSTQMVMQKAVLTYFVTLQMMPQEESRIREMFDQFDLDKDGHLSLEDLAKGYVKVHGDPARAKSDAVEIMKRIDLNRNGTIDFTEFSLAHIQLAKYMQEDMLKKAFNFFDKDGDGQISMQELHDVFGPLVKESSLTAILKEVDKDGDGQISFEEFKEMMLEYDPVADSC